MDPPPPLDPPLPINDDDVIICKEYSEHLIVPADLPEHNIRIMWVLDICIPCMPCLLND